MFLQLCCKVSDRRLVKDHNLFIWMIQASRALDGQLCPLREEVGV